MNLLKYLITSLALFNVIGCSTNIEVNSKFCQGTGEWIPMRFNLEERNTAGEQLFVDQETFVFGGVGVKQLTYEELIEELNIGCDEIKTFRLTTYSTWFESVLSFIPLFRFRSILVSGSYLKNEDASLVKKINEERSNTEESAAIDSPIEEVPDALMDAGTMGEEEFGDDDFEE
jgi:hypothetical protein